MSTSTPAPRSQSCSWRITEPPSLPILAYYLDRIERSNRRLLTGMEELLVDLVPESLCCRTPFELVDAVRERTTTRYAVDVVVNAIVAASHECRPVGRDLSQVMFLSTACPLMIAGAGWLSRLDQQLTARPGVLAAAMEVDDALSDLADRWMDEAA